MAVVGQVEVNQLLIMQEVQLVIPFHEGLSGGRSDLWNVLSDPKQDIIDLKQGPLDLKQDMAHHQEELDEVVMKNTQPQTTAIDGDLLLVFALKDQISLALEGIPHHQAVARSRNTTIMTIMISRQRSLKRGRLRLIDLNGVGSRSKRRYGVKKSKRFQHLRKPPKLSRMISQVGQFQISSY